ncbi:MAG: winged helix-turn-helix domain-containing protein [Thermoanaerobaculia bacterium]|nr:winged helix-turn-helix domain-containing protein [Thermoanaerobaculia bacterium]
MSDAGSRGMLARFGGFELHVSSGELRKNGSRVRLQEQPARLLATLLERAGEVVTRDELRARLWPADTFVDFDHSLNTAVRKLRTALGDSADAPRFVETVARHGYRFVGAVDWADSALAATPRPRERRRTVWLTLVALIAAVAAGVAYTRRPSAALPRVDSVAVLPFTVTDTASDYLGDGLAESLIDGLATSPDLRVAPRSLSFRYDGKRLDPVAVGKELGVSAVVTGSLTSLAPGEYELRTELIGVGDGAHLWAKQYHVSPADLGLLRRQLAFDVGYRLGVTRADDEDQRKASSPAWDRYLRGRYLWHLRGRDNVLRAAEYFERAVELDPEFALGYAGLALAYGTVAGNHYIPDSTAVMQAKAKAAADTALALDETLAEAYVSRAAANDAYYWDFGAAERDFRRAIELKPGLATAHQWYGSHLNKVGRFAEARREIELAYALEPFSLASLAQLSGIRMAERRYDEAIDLNLRMAKVDPALVNYGVLFTCQALAGRFEDAIATMRGAPKLLDPADADPLEAAYRHGGPTAFWRKRAEQLPESNPYGVAACYSMAGERDKAFAHLDKAFHLQKSDVAWFYGNPMFDNIRSDPRFDELARRIGLPQVGK